MTMLILHVSFSSGPKDGGIATSVAQLVEQQRQVSSVDVSWFCLDDYGFLSFYRFIVILFRLRPDVIHIHGLWRYPTRLMFLYKLLGSSVVVSPHGMLHPKALQISRLRKQISLFFFEKPLLHYARCVHALNSFESDSISSISVNSNIVVIPNGVSILSPSTIDCRDLFSLPPDSKILLT